MIAIVSAAQEGFNFGKIASSKKGQRIGRVFKLNVKPKKMERPPMERALSTDVVMDIVLSHLIVEDLLSCRKVSKFWNKAASSILRRRSTRIENISKTKILKELGECLKQSSDFPFAGLRFDRPWRLQSAGAMEFFKNHGARFTSLFLGVSSKTRCQDVAPILNNLPRLSCLQVGWSNHVPPPAESSHSAAGQEDGRILNLPSLRTLRISSELNEDVLREVCTAASPSLRIECLWTPYGTWRALKNVGKLQAISVLNVDEVKHEQDYTLRVDELLSTETPALTKLEFSARGCISQKGLMTLLIWSQHTLKQLSLVGICLSELLSECPVLAKLTTLSVSNEGSCKYCFQGSHGHKFPALTELKLCVYFECPISDGLFIVPTVKRIDLEEYCDKALIKELAQSFPNVVAIGLYCDFQPDQQEWYEIWSVGEFKQLEKLRIWNFFVSRPTKNYINMDSFLTGISPCTRKNWQQEKGEDLLDLIKAPLGEKFSEVLRVKPNILQVQNLKELIICVKLQPELKELPEEPPFMSMVSVKFALEMMPNLEAKFVYDYREPLLRVLVKPNKKAVTMLKAAFKHVQPDVKLEPFFY